MVPLRTTEKQMALIDWLDVLWRVWRGSTLVDRLFLCTVGTVLLPVCIVTWTLLDLLPYACNKRGD